MFSASTAGCALLHQSNHSWLDAQPICQRVCCSQWQDKVQGSPPTFLGIPCGQLTCLELFDDDWEEAEGLVICGGMVLGAKVWERRSSKPGFQRVKEMGALRCVLYVTYAHGNSDRKGWTMKSKALSAHLTPRFSLGRVSILHAYTHPLSCFCLFLNLSWNLFLNSLYGSTLFSTEHLIDWMYYLF